MQNPPLDVERIIGWISFAVGASLLQHSDSTLYEVIQTTELPLFLIYCFILSSVALVGTTFYPGKSRCRIILLVLLDLMWLGILALVSTSGPLGPSGALAFIIVCYLTIILTRKAKAVNDAYDGA
jgi:hypothetical protein